MLQTVDKDELETRLVALMKSYSDALKYTEHLPAIIGTKDIKYYAEKPHLNPNKHISRILRGREIMRRGLFFPNRRFVNRSITKLFVESHIRNKLEIIIKYLRIEASMCLKESDEQAKKLESYIDRLENFKGTLSKWNVSNIFVKPPWIIAFSTPVIVQLIGINISSTDSAINTIKDFFQTSESLHNLVVIGVILAYLFMFFSPMLMLLGFRIKRAIFTGGKTVNKLFEKPDETESILWVNFPDTNIYHLENQVFETIGIPKPKEFPLDFVMNFAVFYIIIIIVFASTVIYDSRGNLEIMDKIGIFSLSVIVISIFKYGRDNFRQRSEKGDM